MRRHREARDVDSSDARGSSAVRRLGLKAVRGLGATFDRAVAGGGLEFQQGSLDSKGRDGPGIGPRRRPIEACGRHRRRGVRLARIPAEPSARRDDAVAGHQHRRRIRPHGPADRSGGTPVSDRTGQLAVGDRREKRPSAQRLAASVGECASGWQGQIEESIRSPSVGILEPVGESLRQAPRRRCGSQRLGRGQQIDPSAPRPILRIDAAPEAAAGRVDRRHRRRASATAFHRRSTTSGR